MTKSTSLALQISETRTALNDAIEERNKLPEGTDPSAELLKKLDDNTKALSRLEIEYRAALTTEDGEADDQEASEPDAEDRELSKLFGRASIVPFMLEATEDRAIQDGPEHELRQATLGEDAPERHFPVEMLTIPEARQTIEDRADNVTPVDAAALADGGQASVLPRVFRRSIASRLGVAMPSVPVGAHVYPIMTGGTTGSMAADSAHVDAGAGAFTGHTLEPIRLTAAYLFRVRQTLQLRNFEEVLRRDLNAVMSDAMDDQIINGDGNAPNVAGFLAELPEPTEPIGAANNLMSYQGYINAAVRPIDGLNAYAPMDLRVVVGADMFKHMIEVYRSDQSERSAWDRLGMLLGGLSVSGRIPAKSAKAQTAITALTSYPGRNAVAPIWRGVELIRDPYTNASKGEVRLTAVMYWNFKVLREAGWHLWRARIEA